MMHRLTISKATLTPLKEAQYDCGRAGAAKWLCTVRPSSPLTEGVVMRLFSNFIIDKQQTFQITLEKPPKYSLNFNLGGTFIFVITFIKCCQRRSLGAMSHQFLFTEVIL